MEKSELVKRVMDMLKKNDIVKSEEEVRMFIDGELIKKDAKHHKVDKKWKRTEKQLHVSQSLPKQCRIVLESITTEPIDIDTWTKNSLENKLETNQQPDRIVMYYRPRLIELGLVEEVK